MRASRQKPKVREPFLKRLWRFFSSVRLALGLILVLVVLCLIGVLLVQAPANVLADPASYDSWVQNNVKPELGVWADIFSFLRLFNVFHSPWFLVAGGLLMINILFCTLNRWRSVAAALRGGNIKQTAAFYRTGNHRAESTIPEPLDQAKPAVSALLKKMRYRVRTEDSGGAVNLAADRNRFSPAGTFLTHLSLILFVLGFLITGFWGFNESAFVVPEGSTKELGHGTGLSLELKSFEDEYWPNGSPKDFRSQVTLYSGDQPVVQDLVRVNSPLSYRGINIFQSSYGPAVRIRITNSGTPIYEDSVPLSSLIESESIQRYVGQISLPEAGIVHLFGPAINGPDPFFSENQIGIVLYREGIDDPVAEVLEMGVPLETGNLQFVFESLEQYSVFQVNRNPGINLIWVACAFLVGGLGLVFYFPYRQLWVVVEAGEGNKNRLMVRATGMSSPGQSEIDSIVRQIKKSKD